jgi:cytochrome c oxidase subunit 2
MNRTRCRKYFCATLPLFLLTALSGASTRVQAGSPRVIEITAKRFGFTPNQITPKRGEPVTLRLTSEDVTQGFFLRPLKIDGEIEPGKSTEITVTPEVAGTFTIICDHLCGAGHGNMKITVVVES